MDLQEFKKKEAEILAQYDAKKKEILELENIAENAKYKAKHTNIVQFCNDNDKLKLKVGDKIQDKSRLNSFMVYEIYEISYLDHAVPELLYKCYECMKNGKPKINQKVHILAEDVNTETIKRK